jgi:hypothetical protein
MSVQSLLIYKLVSGDLLGEGSSGDASTTRASWDEGLADGCAVMRNRISVASHAVRVAIEDGGLGQI